MELRVIEYFLTVVKEQTISGAAKSLHLTQPTLTRQLKNLEDELGKTLFLRGNRNIILTDDGMLFRKRAQEILDLVKKTEHDISFCNKGVCGDVRIGTGETSAIRILAQVAQDLQKQFPQIHYHLSSDDATDVLEDLDKGLIDFGILLGDIDKTKYNYLTFPVKDSWGILMKKDSPLASKHFISSQDIMNKPLITSRQSTSNQLISEWFNTDFSKLSIVATYNLPYTASLFVESGFGYAFYLDKLMHVTGNTNLCFKPLVPKLELEIHLVWKKHQIFTKATETFLDALQTYFKNLKLGKEK